MSKSFAWAAVAIVAAIAVVGVVKTHKLGQSEPTDSASRVLAAPAKARLSVSGPADRAVYSIAAMERFPVRRLITSTPWRRKPAAFEGVRLADVLRAHGLYHAPSVRLTSENGYQIDLPRKVWTETRPLLAFRVEGRKLTRKERGPFYLIFKYDMVSAGPEYAGYWVWSVAQIERSK